MLLVTGDLRFVTQLFRAGHIGHFRVMGITFLIALEGADHGKDRLALLDCLHAPGGKTAAITQGIDLIDDRQRGIAGAQKITVHRMNVAQGVDRLAGRGQ